MAEAVLVLDNRKRILMMNQAAKNWLLDDPSGPIPEALELLGSTEFLGAFEASQHTEDIVRRESKIYRRGEEKTVHISSQKILSPPRVILIVHDISRTVKLESMRQEFVANVSHELKTPVTSILGFVETLLDEDDGKAPQRAKFLGIIYKQSERLRNIIEDLLTLSRLEQEGNSVRLEPGNPIQVVSRALEACSDKADKKGTQVQFQSSFDGTLAMNAPLLEQAIINLVENGIKYGNPGGKVEVVLERQTDSLVISVHDDGPGIPQRELEAVFQRFYRLDKARSRAQGGTGLGLSIVKHIARVHRGTVKAQSSLGRGSVFTLTIPFVQPEDEVEIGLSS
ncbi:MAG: hypothetical protein GW949_03450 [Spirochaetales bacterium]|nr:hypothetical protein [Spirochaetales bacterium]